MTFIPSYPLFDIGDTVELLEDVEVMGGIFKKGTHVTITDKYHRGCTIEDEHGNTASEVTILKFKMIHDATTVIGKEIYDDAGDSESLYIQEVLFTNNEVALVKASFENSDKMINMAIDIDKGRCCIIAEDDAIYGFFYTHKETCERLKKKYYNQ